MILIVVVVMVMMRMIRLLVEEVIGKMVHYTGCYGVDDNGDDGDDGGGFVGG